MANKAALFPAIAFALAVAGAIGLKVCSSRADESAAPVPAPVPSKVRKVRSSPTGPRASTAETVPEGHDQAVAAAERARAAQADRWNELRHLRDCLSNTDVELHDFRDSYNASLVDGVPARRIERMYRISRDNMQRCDRVLQMIEGDGVIAAAEYRRMIAALLPSVLVLRDYHRESDFLEDKFARARQLHPAVVAGLEKLDSASAALRARAIAVRAEIAGAMPPEPRDLAVELYFALLELDDRLTAAAPDSEVKAALARLDEIREAARLVVSDLAGSRRADRLDNVLGHTSGALAPIKRKLRQRSKKPTLRVGPNDFGMVERDIWRGR